jgi:hypothetical protein
MKVGTRVYYIRKDSNLDKSTGYYPPVGTLGTVTQVTKDGYWVKWDKGTTCDGTWFVAPDDIKKKTSTADIIFWSIFIGLASWAIASWVNIITTNTIGSEAVPAAWNLFEIIFG